MKNNDSTLFKGAAWYYSHFRRGYPPAFFDHIIKSFNLNHNSRVLDLGTGTGQIAIPLAKNIKEVVAVDPDQEMLEEGKNQAKKEKVENIAWTQATAEDFSDSLGPFNVTTMGTSFHWMKQDEVLKKIYNITEKDGGIVIVSNTTSIYRNQKNDEWKNIVRSIIEKYLGEKRRAGKAYFKEPQDRFEDIIKRSDFSDFTTFTEVYMQEWTIDQILGFLSSTSFAARRLFGEHIQGFENDLRAELLRLDSLGVFNEEVTLEAFLAWKRS